MSGKYSNIENNKIIRKMPSLPSHLHYSHEYCDLSSEGIYFHPSLPSPLIPNKKSPWWELWRKTTREIETLAIVIYSIFTTYLWLWKHEGILKILTIATFPKLYGINKVGRGIKTNPKILFIILIHNISYPISIYGEK